MKPPADDQNAVGLRLPAHDARLLASLTKHQRSTQSQLVSMALRHLAETINRDGAVYVDTHGISERTPAARLHAQISYHVVEEGGDYLLAVRDAATALPAIGSTIITCAPEDPMAWRVVGHRYHAEPDAPSSSRYVISIRYVQVERVHAERDPQAPGGVRVSTLWDDTRHIPSPVVGGGGQSAPLVCGPRINPTQE